MAWDAETEWRAVLQFHSDTWFMFVMALNKVDNILSIKVYDKDGEKRVVEENGEFVEKSPGDYNIPSQFFIGMNTASSKLAKFDISKMKMFYRALTNYEIFILYHEYDYVSARFV